MVAVFVVGAAVYANTLGHQFVWDDLIALDQRVRFYRSPLDAFIEPADLPGFPGVYRPLTATSFWLDQVVWWRNPLGFHLTSVLLHAANCALVYLLAGALGCRPLAALAGALLFAVHPIHTEAVAWVTARVDVLATTFTVLAVLAYLRLRGVRAALAVGACTFLAAASKEPGALGPLLIAAAATLPDDAVPAAGGADARPPRSTPAALVASAVAVLAYLALRLLNDRSAGNLTFDGAALAKLVGAFGFYVQRLVAPVHFSAYVPAVPAPLATLPFVLLAGTGVILVARAPRARFAFLWILVTLAPSMLVAIAQISVTAVAERYLYLPSVGLALLVALAVDVQPAARSRAALAAGGAVLALLGVATVVRNAVWHDELSLWTNVTAQEPLGLPFVNLGMALADAGRTDEAERAYRQGLAAQGSPTTMRDLYLDLGELQLQAKRYDEAFDSFIRANAIGPHATAYSGLGAIHRARARTALEAGDVATGSAEIAHARAALEAALSINWRHYQAQSILASVLYLGGDYVGALEHYRKVLEIAPDSDAGVSAAESVRELTAWLADPAHRMPLSRQAPAP